MRDILRLLYFLIPLGSIGILAKMETITASQADWLAFGWLALWYLRYFREIKLAWQNRSKFHKAIDDWANSMGGKNG